MAFRRVASYFYGYFGLEYSDYEIHKALVLFCCVGEKTVQT